jgi:hypothetical protein
MGLPDSDDFDQSESPTPLSKRGKQPDWLVGADEGTQSEQDRAGEKPAPVTLRRPDGGAPPPVRAHRGSAHESPPPAPPSPAAEAQEATAPPPPERLETVEASTWRAAGSSVPKLRLAPARERKAPPPVPEENELDFAPVRRMRDLDVGPRDEQADDDAAFAEPHAQASTPRAPKALDEPFYVVWIETARSAPKGVLLGVAGALLAVVLTFVLWPRADRGVGMRQILKNPESFAGQLVRVHGRTGEVFSIGGSYVFNLHDGRDTLVVFSRTRQPQSKQTLTIVGTVSIGYLDGAPRVALLEQAE